MNKKKKPKKKQKEQNKPRNPYDSAWVRKALERIIAEGESSMTRSKKTEKDHIDALVTAMMRAMQQPDAEIRLTYKTTAEALCAWTWMVAACQGKGVLDRSRCSAFDVELRNGSGIMFWTDEGRPSAKKEEQKEETNAGAST